MLRMLEKEIVKKYGEGRLEEYKRDFKSPTLEAMDREIVCQIIARQAWYRRVLFLVLYPGYLLPYLIRIRKREIT
jgi:hypothetical protein